MIFRAIQDKFKVKSGQKFLEDEFKKSRPTPEKKGISSIACIVDMDNFTKAESLQTIKKSYGLPPNSLHIMGYKRGRDNQGMFSIPYCTDRDLGWNGAVENGDFSEFSGRQYDLLINYFVDDRLMLKLMSAQTKARIRAGFKEADNAVNDLIFDCGLQDVNTFVGELGKYLKILKELN